MDGSTYETLTLVFTILVGLIIGSFVNVLVARLPHDESIVRPGSRCPSCKGPIRWFDNIPVASWLALRGKCRGCETKISIRYPLIEVLTCILFVAARHKTGWGLHLFLRDWPLMTMLVAITFIDLEHRIIPDVLSIPGAFLGIATSVAGLGGDRIDWYGSLLGAGLGFGVFYAFAWLYLKYSGRSGLGGGDIKLLAMLGAFLGPAGVFCAILVSSVFGSVVGIGWALAHRKDDILSVAIPYGPFLVVGGLYYYLLGDILWFQFMTPT
jgi:leader peptidase (prepilin peptidase)/N-methyltransferase